MNSPGKQGLWNHRGPNGTFLVPDFDPYPVLIVPISSFQTKWRVVSHIKKT